VGAGAISYIDTTASDAASELIDELAALDVPSPSHASKRHFTSGYERAASNRLGEERLYASVRAGVDDYLSRHPGLQPTSQTSAR
jgi:hypothetical protein